MNNKAFIIVMILAFIGLSQCRSFNSLHERFRRQTESGVDYEITPKSNNPFKDWIKIIEDFFKDGNWGDGGPKDMATFIGRQVSKIVDLLIRDNDYGVWSSDPKHEKSPKYDFRNKYFNKLNPNPE